MSRGTISAIVGVVLVVLVLSILGMTRGCSRAAEVEPPKPGSVEFARIQVKAAREERRIKRLELRAKKARQPRPVLCQPPYFDEEGMSLMVYSVRGNGVVVCWKEDVTVDPVTGKETEEIDEDNVAQFPQAASPLAAPPATPPAPSQERHHRGQTTADCSDCGSERGPKTFFGQGNVLPPESSQYPQQPPQIR